MTPKNEKMLTLLWLCNIQLPLISELLGEKPNAFGGWLDETSRNLVGLGYRLRVLYPSLSVKEGQEGNLEYYGYEGKGTERIFTDFLDKDIPDVIHIWGTELEHCLTMIQVLETKGLLDRTIVSIQGLVSTVAEHYCTKLPPKIVRGKTLRDIVRRSNVYSDMMSYRLRGEKERFAIRKARHIIGRTDFDEAFTKAVNPNANYYKCGEVLRSSFYSTTWDILQTEPYSIFISQASYPIKGFHIFLEALGEVIQTYPNTRVYVAGPDPTFKDAAFHEKFKRTCYGRYLWSLMSKFQLEKSISFLGTLDENQMKKKYLSSRIFVIPSTIENSPNSLGEAMILGMPCIAAYVGGISSMLQDKSEGFLYPADAPYMLSFYIKKLFEEEELSQKLGEFAKCRALEMFSKERNHSELIRIYTAVSREGVEYGSH